MEKLSFAQMSSIEAGKLNWDLVGCIGGMTAAAGAFASFIALSGGTALTFFIASSSSMLSDIAMAFGCGHYIAGVIEK